MKPAVLIADYDRTICDRFSDALREEEYGVIEAQNYKAAIDILTSQHVELVITDIDLGEDSGLDILMRTIEAGLSCPVVILASSPDPEAIEQALRLGAYDFLDKSVAPDVLLRVVKRALHHKIRLELEQMAEQETKRYRYRLLDAIFRNINDAIITVDNDARVIEANRVTKRICHVSPASMVGADIANNDYICSVRCHKALKEALRSKSPVKDYQIECGRKDKPNQTVTINASPLIDENLEFFGAVMIIKDVTILSGLERELEDRYQFHNIIGKSEAMKDMYKTMEALASTETTTLITGETGTGKELVARAIHFSGARALKPFVAVNCSALAEELLESELFGHVRGAFTGAIKDKIGRFKMADEGTIFLDEIGDISPAMQLKLLRALQEREFEPVGSSETIKVDVRVVAATNRELQDRIRLGLFREDLYYRLNVVELKLPPLRERRVDIPLLIDHFLKSFNKKFGKSIRGLSEEALQAMMNHNWPGNVRELEHAIEHGFVLSKTNTITLSSLPPEIITHSRRKGDLSPFAIGNMGDRVPDTSVLEAIKKAGGNKAKAARLLGVSRQTIYRKIGKLKASDLS